MLRYTFFLLMALGSAATAIAAIAPGNTVELRPRNVTVIEKNQAFPLIGPVVFEACQTEDCSDT
jgi:hypothetical protein